MQSETVAITLAASGPSIALFAAALLFALVGLLRRGTGLFFVSLGFVAAGVALTALKGFVALLVPTNEGATVLDVSGAALITVGALIARHAMRSRWNGRLRPTAEVLLGLAVMCVLATTIDVVFDLASFEVAFAVGRALLIVATTGAAVFLTMTVLDANEREASAQRELLFRNERLSALGTLVAGVAHEINNPLMYVRGNIELALLDLAPTTPPNGSCSHGDTTAALLTTALNGTNQIADLTQTLKKIARTRDGPARERVSLTTVGADVVNLVQVSARAAVRIEASADPEHTVVEGRAGDLHRVVLNLVQNACEAAGESGSVVVRVEADARTASIVVHDDGPGISPESRARLFTPFYTTKPDGTGLGLYVSLHIAKDLDGDLRHEDCGRGTTFRLELPRASVPA